MNDSTQQRQTGGKKSNAEVVGKHGIALAPPAMFRGYSHASEAVPLSEAESSVQPFHPGSPLQRQTHSTNNAPAVVQRTEKSGLVEGSMYYLSTDTEVLRYCKYLGTDGDPSNLEYWFENNGTGGRFYYKASDALRIQTEAELAGNGGGVAAVHIGNLIMAISDTTKELRNLLAETGIDKAPKGVTKVTLADRLLSYCLEWDSAWHNFTTKQEQFTDRLSPESWSSCFSTAQKLYDLLGDHLANDQTSGKKATVPAEDNDEKAATNYEALAKVVTAFLKDIEANAGKTERIYNCAFGIHGFSVILRTNRVEMLQSFAHGVGKGLPNSTLAESAASANAYPIGTFLGLFAEMGMEKNADKRHKAQNALFSSWLEDGNEVFPFLKFNWDGVRLKNSSGLVMSLANRITSNLLSLKGAIPQVEGNIKGRGKASKDAKDILGKIK